MKQRSTHLLKRRTLVTALLSMLASACMPAFPQAQTPTPAQSAGSNLALSTNAGIDATPANTTALPGQPLMSPSPTPHPGPPPQPYLLYVDDDWWDAAKRSVASNIYRIDLINGARQRLTNYSLAGEPAYSERTIQGLAISPDCWQVAYWRHEAAGWTLYRLHLDSGLPQTVYARAESISDLAWSPDGLRLAYSGIIQPETANAQALSAIFTLNIDGTNQRQIAPPTTHVASLLYRPGYPDQLSAGLILSTQTVKRPAAYLLADRAGQPEAHQLWGPNHIVRSWYPSGERAIVEGNDPDIPGFNVYIGDMNARLDLLGPNLWSTVPSPDGTKLALFKDQPDKRGIYIAAGDGTNAHKILAVTPNSAYTRLHWTGDGSRLVMLHSGSNDVIETIMPDGSGWLQLTAAINLIAAGGQLAVC